MRDERRRVVLEPRQAPRAVHPEAAQEPDLADGGADVRRQARRRRRAPAARRSRGRAQAPTRRRRPRRRTPRRTPPRPSVCQTRRAPPRGGDRRVPSAPRPHGARSTRRSPMPVTRTSLPGGAVVASEQVARQPVRLRAALVRRPLDGRPPGRGQHGRQREQRPAARAPDGSTRAARP